MISVSNEWKELQQQTLLPEMFVEITYKVTEPGIEEHAMVSATNPETYSNVEQIVDGTNKTTKSYNTLDYGCWGLDGNGEYFNGTPVNPGYIYSGYSDGNCVLAVQPTITISFDERRTYRIPGITITWGDGFNGWATEFVIVASNTNGEVARKLVTGNESITSTIFIDLVDYTQITITVLKWSHPYQRVRCSDIVLGMKNIYTKDDLLDFTHVENVDLLSASLPENTITFKLRNDDDRWNPDSPDGMENYLIEQQEVSVRYGMDVNGTVEWIKGGVYWLSEWNTPSNGMEADFTAKNLLVFMEDTYRGARQGTLYDIAIAALTQAGLSESQYHVDEDLQNITTDFSSDDSDYRVSEVLQLIAHAGNKVLRQDRNGVLRLEKWNESYSNYIIDEDISYSHPEYTLNKPLKTVSVGYGSNDDRVALEHAPKGEVQTIDNPLLLTRDDATRVGRKAMEILKNRKVVSGEYRADVRMDALDNVTVVSKYSTNIIGITGVEYSMTGGSFRGKYTGRVVSIELTPVTVYSNEIYSNEIW